MDQNILTVVPPELKKLVRLVTRAFYQPEHFLVMDILAKHPCVTEEDLLHLLRFELKKLRFILAFLKKDKLIKNIQRVESVESTTSSEKKNITVQYYYINYKVFVNVVKYKLHRIREKIRSDERKSRNRMMYTCKHCQNSFTDLDVDRLLDPIDQKLRCIMCRSELEEDVPEGNVIDAKSLLSNLNVQLQPILTLLKETENMNLSPDLLEPEPHGINKQVLEASRRHRQQQGSKVTDQWTTSKADDIYGDQTVSISFDGEDKAAKGKAVPQWMAESTVYTGDKMGGDTTVDMETSATKSTVSDGEILALLINESKKPSDGSIPPPTHGNESDSSSSSSYEDSSSEGGEGMTEGGSASGLGSSASGREAHYHPSPYMAGNDDEDDEDDEFDSDEDDVTMKVGNSIYKIDDITPEVVAQMNQKEKDKYTELCQQAYSNYY